MTDKVAKAETSKNAAGIPTVKVSSGRSVFFYVDLATKFLKDGPEIELSGLGYGANFLRFFWPMYSGDLQPSLLF
jgi:hypothetical protein